MTQQDDILELSLDKLLLADADALDSKDMKRWLDNYSQDDDASYICRSAENTEHGLELGFMYDDCRARLEDRVTFVNDIWAGTFQDYRTRHFVQRLNHRREDSMMISVRSNFSVFMTPEDSGVTQVLAAGQYLDSIQQSKSGELKFLYRRAELDTAVLPRYLVYPI